MSTREEDLLFFSAMNADGEPIYEDALLLEFEGAREIVHIQTREEQELPEDKVRLRLKFLNTCCLSDDKLVDVMEELQEGQWDLFGVAETWRKKKAEEELLPGGHLLLAAGGRTPNRGVALVVNKRHRQKLKGWKQFRRDSCGPILLGRDERAESWLYTCRR